MHGCDPRMTFTVLPPSLKIILDATRLLMPLVVKLFYNLLFFFAELQVRKLLQWQEASSRGPEEI